jgi:thiol-disulfide isomerase/thioredoxin
LNKSEGEIMKKYLTIFAIMFAMLFLVSCSGSEEVVIENGTETTGTSDDATLTLAECLTESGAKFYGAYWCPHCIDQKEMFGDAIDSAPYVECTEEEVACNAAGITGYPTWIFGDGTMTQGAQSLETLAELSGCEY